MATKKELYVFDFDLRASQSDVNVIGGPSRRGVVLAFQKPGLFVVDNDPSTKNFSFHVMRSVRVADKALYLTCLHSNNENRTLLDGTLVMNPANKFSAIHVLGTGFGRFKYSYVHSGVTTIEPSYEIESKSWGFEVSWRVYDGVFKASYQTRSKIMELEWSTMFGYNGTLKVSASWNLAEERKVPKITVKTSTHFVARQIVHITES